MTITNTIEPAAQTRNGVDVGQVLTVIGEIEKDPNFAKFQWRATNRWVDGALSRSRIKEFFGGNGDILCYSEDGAFDGTNNTIVGSFLGFIECFNKGWTIELGIFVEGA